MGSLTGGNPLAKRIEIGEVACRLSLNELKLIEDSMREKLAVLRSRAPLTNLATRADLTLRKLGEIRMAHEKEKRAKINNRERLKRAAARQQIMEPADFGRAGIVYRDDTVF